jgi:hypothetical protein
VTAAPPQPGATAAAGAIKILLTGEAVTGNEIELPKWAIYQLKPGRMLLPLKKSGSSYEAFGAGYEIPALPQGNEKLFADVFNQYKQLAPEKENDFLKNLLLDSKFKMLQFPALRKIIVAGEFSRKLNAAELEYWHKFYLTLGDDMALKSTLLNNLSSQNFDANSPLFLAALEDRQVSGIAGRLFMRQDKTVFTAKMMQFLEEPAKREIALRNAAALSGNPEFVAKAMKYFDPNDNKMFVIYVPLLTAKNNPAGKEFIIKFLEESDREKDFSARFMLMATIWRSNNSDYVNETKSFITAEENNTKLMKSPAYLFALGYLYRNNDLDGMKMLLKYLDSVKPGSREEMMLRNLISNLRIRVVSAPVAASGSAVAAPLKPEKIQRSATRITPVELLRRHLELTITNSENIQQNTTSNAKELLKK